MDEGRKRVLLIAASILAARKLAQLGERRSPTFEAAIADAISTAERILARIDREWPSVDQTSRSRGSSGSNGRENR